MLSCIALIEAFRIFISSIIKASTCVTENEIACSSINGLRFSLILSESFLESFSKSSLKFSGKIIAAAVTVYIHTNTLTIDSLPTWLHVVLPSKDASGAEIAGQMPEWIPLACYSAIAAGTLSGGWKIVKTMGSKITKVTAFEGVIAESAGALTLFMTEHFKIPVSTTHTITGSIIGVGVSKRVSAVKWGVTVSLIWAWILTIPVSGIIAMITYYILSIFI